jgi:predicted Rossmann fold nucleotide-binding protein DprA/Smf involved in DNA uptake
LTARFDKRPAEENRPLSSAEWGRLAAWLHQRGEVPESLLGVDCDQQMAEWKDRSITPSRIRYLLGRAGAMAIALERWQRAGIWVLTRADDAYPDRLKRRLRLGAPPVLFGIGRRSLLEPDGVAIVGSRNALGEDLDWARRTAAEFSRQGRVVISGGARGVDDAAMEGALQAQGTAVCVLADSLVRASTAARLRDAIIGGDLLLLSPFNPEAGFDVGNAMARNKYIYCLAEAAIVVAAEEGRGGTWSGAVETLRHNWVPVFVREPSEATPGIKALVRLGANVLSPNFVSELSRLRSPSGPGSDHGPLDGAGVVAEQVGMPLAAAVPEHEAPRTVAEGHLTPGAERSQAPGGAVQGSLFASSGDPVPKKRRKATSPAKPGPGKARPKKSA